MHDGMGGPHYFVMTVKSNDPMQPSKELHIKAKFPPNSNMGMTSREAPMNKAATPPPAVTTGNPAERPQKKDRNSKEPPGKREQK